MAKNLVIVESPAKANTIQKYLGKNFEVKSSYGHIRDLPKNKLGVDVERDFLPEYQISSDKKKIVKELQEAVNNAEVVWLATDEDREGEAIAWHLYEVLNLKNKVYKRITFHEITKPAILKAIENPRDLDYNLINAQQARRILDRLVGYELSELLWKKVTGAVSAGRVQSVAVRLIVEREEQIRNFVPEKYFKITANFKFDGFTIKAELPDKLNNLDEAYYALNKFAISQFVVSDISVKQTKRKPQPPFTTSTLQQEANRKLGFSVTKTMQLAQSLYEAGKITYMRTDSTAISDEAVEKIKNFIIDNFSEKYYKFREYKTTVKNAQEAHEAIRPTQMVLKVSDDPAEQKLYELIFYRTIACLMADAIIEKTTINISPSEYDKYLVASAEVVKFDGFLKIYNYSDLDENADDNTSNLLPPIQIGQKLELVDARASEKLTQQPYRYNEASLVNKLEELGIGRPSTYAPIISTIQKRNYVVKTNIEGKSLDLIEIVLKNSKLKETTKKEIYGQEKNKFKPTDIGILVTAFLKEYFPSIVDYTFTAKIEKDLDQISNGKLEWQELLKDFYVDFHANVVQTQLKASKITGERLLGQHPQTKQNIYVKIAKYGPVIQIGEISNQNKPTFFSIPKKYSIDSITLEDALKIIESDKNGRLLGIDPITNKPIYVRYAKYGPIIQLGSYEDSEKPKFFNLPNRIDLDSFTLEMALKYLSLPFEITKYLDEPIVADKGKFGPYIRWKNIFVSIKTDEELFSLSAENAIELIKEKIEKEQSKIIKAFNDDLKIMKDRFGKIKIYYKGNYFAIPPNSDPLNLTEEQCLQIINSKQK